MSWTKEVPKVAGYYKTRIAGDELLAYWTNAQLDQARKQNYTWGFREWWVPDTLAEAVVEAYAKRSPEVVQAVSREGWNLLADRYRQLGLDNAKLDEAIQEWGEECDRLKAENDRLNKHMADSLSRWMGIVAEREKEIKRLHRVIARRDEEIEEWREDSTQLDYHAASWRRHAQGLQDSLTKLQIKYNVLVSNVD